MTRAILGAPGTVVSYTGLNIPYNNATERISRDVQKACRDPIWISSTRPSPQPTVWATAASGDRPIREVAPRRTREGGLAARSAGVTASRPPRTVPACRTGVDGADPRGLPYGMTAWYGVAVCRPPLRPRARGSLFGCAGVLPAGWLGRWPS